MSEGIELLEADLQMAAAMFPVLQQAASVDGVEWVEISYRAQGGDTVTVGYGVQAEPAVIKVVPAEDVA